MPKKLTARPLRDDEVHFDVWGCRGSRNLLPRRSSIGNHTSCYSVTTATDAFVFDAGRGLAAFGHALMTEPRFSTVRRVHVLITHAHMDHWEGLKDADWFWRRGNGLEVKLYGTAEAIGGIRAGYAHPLYVPLDLLAMGTVARLEYVTISAEEKRTIGSFSLRTSPLNHYSGSGDNRRFLDTAGFRLAVRKGPTVAYLSDHEPHAGTAETERKLITGAHLAVYDSHFPDIKQQMHGHGSQEHASNVARAHPGVLVLAGHHAPSLSDQDIRATWRRHGKGAPNFQLAIEGRTYAFDRARGAFSLLAG